MISLWLEDSVFRMSPTRFRKELIIPALLDLAGDRIAKATQTLTVSTAGPEASQALAISENAPVAEVRRVVCDSSGTVIYVCDLVYRSDYINGKWTCCRPVDKQQPSQGRDRADQHGRVKFGLRGRSHQRRLRQTATGGLAQLALAGRQLVWNVADALSQ